MAERSTWHDTNPFEEIVLGDGTWVRWLAKGRASQSFDKRAPTSSKHSIGGTARRELLILGHKPAQSRGRL